MVKKLISILLAAVIVLLLAACGISPAPGDSTAASNIPAADTPTTDSSENEADKQADKDAVIEDEVTEDAVTEDEADAAPVDDYPDFVDLRGQSFSLDEMNALCDEHPDSVHLFSFTIAGVETDSTVKELDISGHELSGVDGILPYLRFMPELTYVDMSGCGLSNDQMEQLCDARPDVKFVWIITFGIWEMRTDTVAFSTQCGDSNPNMLTSSDLEVLKYCTDLRALDLGHHAISDLSWVEPLTELRVLILACNQITDITPLAQLKELRYLELFNNCDLVDISPLAGLENLMDLNLCHCYRISDFSPLENLPRLERLWVSGTKCSGNILRGLADAHPEAEIFRSDTGSATDGNWRKHERYYAMRDMFENNYLHELFV